jgi:hypothetical protein
VDDGRSLDFMMSPASHPRPRPASSVAGNVPLAPFSFDDLVERVRAEFIEQPGLRLTEAQAVRLWHLDQPTCARVLEALTEGSFLRCGTDGRYIRR